MTPHGATSPLALIIVLTIALGTVYSVEESRLRTSRAWADSVALAASNAEAARDSTRDVAMDNARVAKIAGDSLRIVEKRIVQVTQGRDALDEALQRERKATYALSTALQPLSAERMTPSAARSSATFHIRDEPYTVDADVALPPPPDSASLRLHIALDTLSMRVRVTCSRAGAAVVVEAPPWAHVALGNLSQDPEVCTTPGEQARPRRWRLRPVLGAGRVFAPMTNAWGAFVGLGLTL